MFSNYYITLLLLVFVFFMFSFYSLFFFFFFFLMIRRPPRSTLSSSSAASDVYKRQYQRRVRGLQLIHMAHNDADIVLRSKDEREFKVKFGIALMSETIKALASYPEEVEEQEEWNPPQSAIPLPPVEGNILEKVIEYCTYHSENQEAKEDERDAWDKKFAQVDDDTLFSLILAANYLDIKPLLDLTCKTVADYIKACKTPQEIRRRFNIKNDFTPEEEEEVRKENAWCEER
eukprot:TRINITY_DN278_c0_g1_i45.p1 TRINITY_DN278_c0_g1~~TRINITY_DN278_c0_g1_i45.p1  ORF type:complete len:232 (+),score=103.91 TRINITY_DN278_c0_g1_i45:1-696(+)